jgi:hypothetical protein
MDQRMCESRVDTIEHGQVIWRVPGTGLEEECGNYGFPVVAVQDKLIFKEVDPCSLIVAFAEKVAIVVEGDLAR